VRFFLSLLPETGESFDVRILEIHGILSQRQSSLYLRLKLQFKMLLPEIDGIIVHLLQIERKIELKTLISENFPNSKSLQGLINQPRLINIVSSGQTSSSDNLSARA